MKLGLIYDILRVTRKNWTKRDRALVLDQKGK